jgi:hypothetical protein
MTTKIAPGTGRPAGATEWEYLLLTARKAA